MITKKEFKEIRVKLLRKDVSLNQIAKKFYVSREMVGLALREKRNSDLAKKIRAYVVELLAE